MGSGPSVPRRRWYWPLGVTAAIGVCTGPVTVANFLLGVGALFGPGDCFEDEPCGNAPGLAVAFLLLSAVAGAITATILFIEKPTFRKYAWCGAAFAALLAADLVAVHAAPDWLV
ncbi:hypothetical protein [Actinomadura verrucosospora]|uniref:Uncharacterized protein n=1 Tax=Actinomadura verrucosospora TaxID=46165 RepID=A0A7D3VV54_ACTVE|nr:hypothetical protein [Actinomadura verrucosospora]QKG23853.1 hypothetical protein ACTIVE_5496 [Actinomadura verrucosospora]